MNKKKTSIILDLFKRNVTEHVFAVLLLLPQMYSMSQTCFRHNCPFSRLTVFSRLFAVSELKHRIDLLWETFYHQRCVLSVASCSLEDRTGNR